MAFDYSSTLDIRYTVSIVISIAVHYLCNSKTLPLAKYVLYWCKLYLYSYKNRCYIFMGIIFRSQFREKNFVILNPITLFWISLRWHLCLFVCLCECVCKAGFSCSASFSPNITPGFILLSIYSIRVIAHGTQSSNKKKITA